MNYYSPLVCFHDLAVPCLLYGPRIKCKYWIRYVIGGVLILCVSSPLHVKVNHKVKNHAGKNDIIIIVTHVFKPSLHKLFACACQLWLMDILAMNVYKV